MGVLREVKACDCFVYAITTESGGHVKIGVSKDPAKRLGHLQTSNHERLRIVSVHRCKSEDEAYALEAQLHGELSGTRTGGEWFVRTEKADRLISLFEGGEYDPRRLTDALSHRHAMRLMHGEDFAKQLLSAEDRLAYDEEVEQIASERDQLRMENHRLRQRAESYRRFNSSFSAVLSRQRQAWERLENAARELDIDFLDSLE